VTESRTGTKAFWPLLHMHSMLCVHVHVCACMCVYMCACAIHVALQGGLEAHRKPLREGELKSGLENSRF
jgi:uncharacterized membrane protein